MRSAAQWSLSLALGSLLPVLPRVAATGRTCNHSRACSPFFFLPSRLDTIGLDSMNELASATRARCVESSLIKGSSLLCRHLIHMHMLFLVSCLIFFCSRSRVFSPHLLSILYVPSNHGSTSHCLPCLFCVIAHVVYYCSWLSFRSVFKASKCMYELLFVVQYSM